MLMTLETIPLFRLLDRDELQALRVIAQERQFAAGQEIFQEGAPGDGVYFVKFRPGGNFRRPERAAGFFAARSGRNFRGDGGD